MNRKRGRERKTRWRENVGEAYATYTQCMPALLVDELIVNSSATTAHCVLVNKRVQRLDEPFKGYSRYLSKVCDANMKQVRASIVLRFCWITCNKNVARRGFCAVDTSRQQKQSVKHEKIKQQNEKRNRTESALQSDGLSDIITSDDRA